MKYLFLVLALFCAYNSVDSYFDREYGWAIFHFAGAFGWFSLIEKE